MNMLLCRCAEGYSGANCETLLPEAIERKTSVVDSNTFTTKDILLFVLSAAALLAALVALACISARTSGVRSVAASSPVSVQSAGKCRKLTKLMVVVVCTNVCVYSCVLLSVFVRVSVLWCICVCVCAFTQACICIHLYIYVCVCEYEQNMYVCVCEHEGMFMIVRLCALCVCS